MSDTDKWYLKDEKEPSLRMWIFRNMAMGAIGAGLILFGIIAVILIIRAIGLALPDDPFAMIEAGRAILPA